MFGPPNFRALSRGTSGSQIHAAMPMNENSNETVTTSLIVSVVCWRPRKIATSRNAPNSGPSTRRTTAIAIGVGQPQSNRSCQYANAPSIPIAPWAKLNTPVVVYVSTSPLAATARIAAVDSPAMV